MHDKAKVVIVFDDGLKTVYTEAFPIMQSRGLVGNIAVNSAKVSSTSFMTIAELHETQNAGWLIHNHTHNHLYLDAESDASVLSEYITCHDWLVSNGFQEGAKWVIFPYNRYTPNVLNILKNAGCVYASGRGLAQSGARAGERFEESRSGAKDTTPAALLISRINNTISKRLYLHLYFHHIGDPAVLGEWTNSVADFTEVMTYLKTKSDEGVLDVVRLDHYINQYADNSRVTIKRS